ncbi:MraY family glycosyltransferase [Mucilaginibacter ginkgonis]|uniref:Glycosyltransferase family 4 protein n=1 Tax=Mucilaginibacter ginkgonis TaxID=2682091 RepID=A0A6I4IP15_9SPHI|nr:glycosyltransferase family 4 protein [Mucilaginibacter ginkgonis]QQL50861.1 glycosyltransferase family 4 protein [Mucilaginibacter ginkgonis]
MSVTIIALTIVVLFICEVIYFKIASHFNIVDKPNHRSSHTKITIRGGGIIFTIAMLLCSLAFGLKYPFFLIGLVLLAVISFLDDMKPISSNIRIVVHVISALLLLMQLNMIYGPFYLIIGTLLLVIATINAVNFMDGINGITGLYATVVLATLYYLNLTITFTNSNYLLVAIIAVLVFNFFNFRKRAICFAGDVGSVAISFIILFFLLQLIIKTNNLSYLLFIALYVLDTSTTIGFRVIRKEKITDAHRSHFYQYLANGKSIPHLIVASLYGLIQLIVNIAVIKSSMSAVPVFVLVFTIFFVVFLIARFIIEGKKRLMTP